METDDAMVQQSTGKMLSVALPLVKLCTLTDERVAHDVDVEFVNALGHQQSVEGMVGLVERKAVLDGLGAQSDGLVGLTVYQLFGLQEQRMMRLLSRATYHH